MEIRHILLRCSDCGTRKRFSLNQEQVRRLVQDESLQFRCGYCSGQKPWRVVEPLDLSPQEPAEEQEIEGKNVLVVDDDDLTLQLLQKVLGSWEVHIEMAQNGQEALQKLAAGKFDLLICDIHMPEMTGEELFEHLQKKALLPRNRIIFLTGDKSVAVKKFLDSSGCIYLYKPIQFLNFSEQVQTVLSG